MYVIISTTEPGSVDTATAEFIGIIAFGSDQHNKGDKRMSKALVHNYVIPIKGVKRKIIYQFSDLHINLADELSSESEKQTVAKNIDGWNKGRLGFAMAFNELCGEDQLAEAHEHLEALLEKAQEDGDALILAGDIFDYINGAHIRFFEKRFSNLSIPFVAVCGNHEPTEQIPNDGYMATMKQPVQILDLDDLVIIALDNSKRIVSAEQIDAVKAQLTHKKPIIIAMHIPILTENNKILKHREEYYHLNYMGCPKENLEFIDLICSNSEKIAAIFAGHLHFLNVCELKPGLTQYVSSQGLLGNINRYTVGE